MENFQETELPEMDGAVAALIQERAAEFSVHPEGARTWEEVKRSIGKA